MYGVVAGPKQNGARRKPATREPIVTDTNLKRVSLAQKCVDYVWKRFQPTREEAGGAECSAAGGGEVRRYRPEGLDALAQSSRFTTHEIKLMYRGFKQECPSGVVDEEAFKNIFCQFFPLGDASQYAHLVFNTMKHKHSGKLNFEEFLGILSRVARGSLQEKLSWVFTLYDVDGDGRISRSEMVSVVQAIYELVGCATAPPVHPAAAKDHVDRIFHLIDTNADGVVTPDELWGWCSRDPALLQSLDTLDTLL